MHAPKHLNMLPPISPAGATSFRESIHINAFYTHGWPLKLCKERGNDDSYVCQSEATPAISWLRAACLCRAPVRMHARGRYRTSLHAMQHRGTQLG